MNEEATIKNLTEDIINEFLNFINEEDLRGMVDKIIRKGYDKGLEQAELDFNMNFIPNHRTVEFINNFTFENVKDLTNNLKDNLRKEVSIALMNRETPSNIRSRIRDVMDTTIERAKMIQVTETNRAENMGHYQGAKESGLNIVKKWDAQPERTSRAGNKVPCIQCESLDGQEVGIDDKFKDHKGREFFLPPTHPNCACRVIYVQKDDDKK